MFSAIFTSAVENHYADVVFKKSYKAYIIALAVAILFWWPANHISHFVQFNTRPSTLFFAIFVLLGFALYFAIRVPARSARGHVQGSFNVEQWMKYGDATPWVLFLGAVAFSVFRIIVYTALGLPFIVTSLAVSGAGIGATTAAVGIVMCFAFTIDMVTRSLYAVLAERPAIRILILTVVLLLFFLLSVQNAPHLNPIVALQSIVTGAESMSLIAGEYGTVAFRHRAIGSFAISAGVAAALYAGSLYLFRYLHWRNR